MKSGSQAQELFEDLIQELVAEGQETGEFPIDSMRFAQMEMVAHELGKELSRRVQEALTESQTSQKAKSFPCPRAIACVLQKRIRSR